MSEGEITKMAMKQWRETPKDEKLVWEKRAANETENKEEKKRKRDDETTEQVVGGDLKGGQQEEKENITKKVKTSEVKQKATSKLAGFAFSKRQ